MNTNQDSNNSELKNTKKVKKPIFKRIWFWLIIVAVVIGVGASISQNENKATKVNDTQTQSQTQDNSSENKGDFKIGDVISQNEKEITVKSVERNYNTGNEFVEPDSGTEFIKVDILIENKSDEKISYNVFDWQIQDSDGNIETYTDAIMAQPKNGLGSGELAKGGKKSGSIVFQVPKGDKGLILHYKSSFWNNETIQIKL
ncbi:MAG: DUF4352 domain-containing protein [Bifidobacteriaceae bacterium]|jgi:hypothetical protein|nr:DUF4352 domain-containing protein [Bifidobacteriaceae bacterium]